ncbi:MAG: DNA-directed RNA polymerase subunit N [Euryarchaeota archaeon]|nr:DNA-directed RNA polymerase subunit N [Euryarchaeota archaeon]DAC17456.1 MAG TPA: DNA-directed RNA polymerase subunit N [Candidatus Poseidoniales archaeon]HII62595.1 DNA-directed RNA polymerase subunit N [Candidatus Poseidoniaceae archaeon]|tara:strand:+ start:2115 stop:2324 length:210 start_codon:yes stop_codon:yes gene_type:complete
MIIPIRCFSCGALIAHKWDEFNDKVSAGIEVGQALDEVGLDRYCCRRMYLGHVELIHEVAPFSTYRKKS